MKSVLSEPHFHNEEAAYEFVEARVWPNGPVCPHCGSTDRIGKLAGKSTRPGVYKCYACRKPFTVKVGTVMEASHVPLRIWLQAIFLLSSSKKGISTNQLARTLKTTLKTAWFLSHRIREAMRVDNPTPIGGEGKIVEADETYFGGTRRRRSRFVPGEGWKLIYPDMDHKQKIVSLVERGGEVRSVHAASLTQKNVRDIVLKNASRLSRLMTDESNIYPGIGREFVSHQTVQHSVEEWVRGIVHSNTIESVFSVFKRGMRGVYQHCAEKHLHRYLAEFDFRYNNRIALGVDDVTRAERAVSGIVGKRLTYRTTSGRV